ncbi:MAG: STAS domain-containing protein [Ruminococcaceae bacterium]|nr:STAS domain-containing protein [Oscillospiraceae bacterium]
MIKMKEGLSMENITLQLDGQTLKAALHGNIDTTNAPMVEKTLFDFLAGNPAQNAEVDCEDLKYISSAGLRVILRLKKAIKDTRIFNVSSEVYEIFDVTGFTEMMDVQKAYRVVSVDGCEVIGQGANGKVYRIDPETIVKVYLNPDALPEIHRERELARTAFVLGIPTAIPYDVVRIADGGYGSVFELLNATSFAKLLARGEMDTAEIARRSIDLLKLIHGTVVKPDAVPDMKQVAIGWADDLNGFLEPELEEKLRALIHAVPDDNHMLHGDYHVKNVMFQNGESLLIDMDTICHGHPIFELGSMFNAYYGFLETDHDVAMRFLGIPYETAVDLWNKELRLYLDGADEETVRAVEAKAMLIGHTRILRRQLRRGGTSTEAGRLVVENSHRHLQELLPVIDSLVF